MYQSRSESPAEVDFSVIRTSIDMGHSMIDQILHGIHYGSAEVRGLLREECDFILECKVCKNLFRSFANFVAHKRVYCMDSIQDTETEEVARNSETETVVIQPESPKSKESAKEGKTVATVGNVDENKNDRTTVLDAVVQKSYKSNSKEYQFYTEVAERMEHAKAAKVTNTITLKSIPESSNAVLVEYKDSDQSNEVEERISPRQSKTTEKGQESVPNTDSVKKKSTITEVCANLLEKQSAANRTTNKDHLLEEISEPHLERSRKSAPKKLNSNDSKTDEGAKTSRMEIDDDDVSEVSGGTKQNINTSKQNSPKKTPSPQKMDTSPSDTAINHSWMKFCDMSSRRCIKCNKEYSSVDGLKYHAQVAHGDGTKLSKCPLCLKEFSYFSSVERHLRNVHNNTEQQITEFRKKMNVRNKYLERVSSENTKSAGKSGKSLSSMSSWNRCKKCDKLFSKVKTYKKHIRINCTPKDKSKSQIPDQKKGGQKTDITSANKDYQSSNDPKHVYEEQKLDKQSLLYKTLTSPSGKSPTLVYVYPKSPIQDKDNGKNKLKKNAGKSRSSVLTEKHKEVSIKDNLLLGEAAHSVKVPNSKDKRETRSTSSERHGKDQNEAHRNSPGLKSAFTKLDNSKIRVELKKLEDRLMTEATGKSPKTPDTGKGLPSNDIRKTTVSTSQKDAHENIKAKQTVSANQEKTPDKLNKRNINNAFRSSTVSQDTESSGSISCPNSPSSVSSNSADGYSHKFKMTVKEMAELVESANLRKFARERRKHAHDILNKKSKKDGLGGKLLKPMKRNLRRQQILPKKVYSTRFSSGNKTVGIISINSKMKGTPSEKGRENGDGSNTPTHQLRSKDKVMKIGLSKDARKDDLQKNSTLIKVGNGSKSDLSMEVTGASKQPAIVKPDDLHDKKLSKELRLLQNTPGFNEKRYYDSSAKLRVSKDDVAELKHADSGLKITKIEQQRSDAREVNRMRSHNEKRPSECKMRASKESGTEFQVFDADLKINKADRSSLTMQEENNETKTTQSKQLSKGIKSVQNSKGQNIKGYSIIDSKPNEDVSTELHGSNASMSQNANDKGKMSRGVAEKQNNKKAESQQTATEINERLEAPGAHDLRPTPKAICYRSSEPEIKVSDANTEGNRSNLESGDLESYQVSDQLNKRQSNELRRLRNSSGFNETSFYTSYSKTGLSKEDIKTVHNNDSEGKLNLLKQGTLTPKQSETESKDDLQNRRLSKELKMLANSPGFNERGYYISSRASSSPKEDKQSGSSDLQTKVSASSTRKKLQENMIASNLLKQMLLAAQKSVHTSKTIMNRKSPVKGVSSVLRNMKPANVEEVNLLSQISEKKEPKKTLLQKDVITLPTQKESVKTTSTEQNKSCKDSMHDSQTAGDNVTTVPKSSLPETLVSDKSGTVSSKKGDVDTPSTSNMSEEENPRDSPPFIFLTKLPDDVIVSYKMIDSDPTDVVQASTETLEPSDDIRHYTNLENDVDICSDNQNKSDEQEVAYKMKPEFQSESEHKPYRTRLSTGSIVFNSDVLRQLEEDAERDEEWDVVSKGPNKSVTNKESQSMKKASLPDGRVEIHGDRVGNKILQIVPMRKDEGKIKHQITVMDVNDIGSGKIHAKDLNVTCNDTDNDASSDISGARSLLTSNIHRTRLSTGSIFFDPEHFKTSPQKPDSDKGSPIDTTEVSKVRKTLTLLEKQRIAGTDTEKLQITRKEPEKFSLATGVKACEYCKRRFWKIRAYSEHVRRGKCGQYRREKMKQKRSLSQSPESNVSQCPGSSMSQSHGRNVSLSNGSNVSQSLGKDVPQSPGNGSQSHVSNNKQTMRSHSEVFQHIAKRPRVVLETESKSAIRNDIQAKSQDKVDLLQNEVKTTNKSNCDKQCNRNDGDNVDKDKTKDTVASLTDIKSETVIAVSETEAVVSKLPPNDTDKTSDAPNQTEQIPVSVLENVGTSTTFTEDSDDESEFSGFSEADLIERELEIDSNLDNSIESEIIDVEGNDSDVEKEEPRKREVNNTTVSTKKTLIKPKGNPWSQKRPYNSTFRSFVCDGKKSRKLVCQQMKTIDRMVDSVNLVCRCCNSKHTSVSNLRQHAIRHLGWKRYKCNICSCLKYNLSEVRLHLNRKHGIQTMDLGLNTLVTDLKKAARKIRISKRSNTMRDLREKGISSKSSPDTYARPRPKLKPTTTKAGRNIKRKEDEELSSKVLTAQTKRKLPQQSEGWQMIQLDEKRLSPLKRLVPPEGSNASILSRARQRLSHVLNPSTSLPN